MFIHSLIVQGRSSVCVCVCLCVFVCVCVCVCSQLVHLLIVYPFPPDSVPPPPGWALLPLNPVFDPNQMVPSAVGHHPHQGVCGCGCMH